MPIVRLSRQGLPKRVMNNFAIAGLGDMPTLDLNFLGGANPLPQSVSFLRATGPGIGATRIGPTGLIEICPANLFYNTNFKIGSVPGSPGVTPTYWSVSNPPTGVVRTLSYGDDSFGSYVEIRYNGNNSSGSTAYLTINNWGTLIPAAVGEIFTFSGYISLVAGAWPTTAYIQLADLDGVGGWLNSYSLTDIKSLATPGKGPVFISLTRTTAHASTGYLGVYTPGISVVNGEDVDCTYRVYFPQVERASTPSPYILSTSVVTGVPRFDYDPITLAPRGLLIEEQRTNLLTNSVDFSTNWSKLNSSLSASGTFLGQTAYKLVENAAAAVTHYTTQGNAKAASAITYTGSVLVKAGERGFCDLVLRTQTFSGYQIWKFDLSTGVNANSGTLGFTAGNGYSINMGSGIWLCVITATTDTDTTINFDIRINNSYGNPTYNGDGTSGIYIGCPQLEQGAFATSYIPTTSAAVTRAADIASMTGTNFSSWFNATEGTFVAKSDHASNSNTSVVFQVDDGGNTNRILLFNGREYYIGVASVTQADIVVGSSAVNTPLTVAASYKQNDFSAAQAGVLGTPDNSGNIPTVNVLNIGRLVTGQYLNGHIQRLTYYNKRLPDATLQALST